MSFQVVAFSESFLNDGTFQNVAAVADESIFVAGDDVRIPQGLNHLVGAVGAVGTQAALLRGRISAPSLRGFINMELIPLIPEEQVSLAAINHQIWPQNPIPLAVGESIGYESDGGGDGVTAEDVSAVVWLSDGPLQAVRGDIRTVRATTAVTTVQNAWTSGPLTFSEDLPAGRYQVVGARFQDINLLAGRLIFVGGASRPGTLGVSVLGAPDLMGARMGGWGVWGEFDINQPPTAEFLSTDAVDTNPEVYLDVMRIG